METLRIQFWGMLKIHKTRTMRKIYSRRRKKKLLWMTLQLVKKIKRLTKILDVSDFIFYKILEKNILEKLLKLEIKENSII